jgi:hypothetical protein
MNGRLPVPPPARGRAQRGFRRTGPLARARRPLENPR